MRVENFLFPDQSCRVLVFPLDFFFEYLYLRNFGRVESNLNRGRPSDKVAVMKHCVCGSAIWGRKRLF
jgi:hypothetical protein